MRTTCGATSAGHVLFVFLLKRCTAGSTAGSTDGSTDSVPRHRAGGDREEGMDKGGRNTRCFVSGGLAHDQSTMDFVQITHETVRVHDTDAIIVAYGCPCARMCTRVSLIEVGSAVCSCNGGGGEALPCRWSSSMRAQRTTAWCISLPWHGPGSRLLDLTM